MDEYKHKASVEGREESDGDEKKKKTNEDGDGLTMDNCA